MKRQEAARSNLFEGILSRFRTSRRISGCLGPRTVQELPITAPYFAIPRGTDVGVVRHWVFMLPMGFNVTYMRPPL